MKKYQRMHLIFIRQYIMQIMEYKVDFVVQDKSKKDIKDTNPKKGHGIHVLHDVF